MSGRYSMIRFTRHKMRFDAMHHAEQAMARTTRFPLLGVFGPYVLICVRILTSVRMLRVLYERTCTTSTNEVPA